MFSVILCLLLPLRLYNNVWEEGDELNKSICNKSVFLQMPLAKPVGMLSRLSMVSLMECVSLSVMDLAGEGATPSRLSGVKKNLRVIKPFFFSHPIMANILPQYEIIKLRFTYWKICCYVYVKKSKKRKRRLLNRQRA